MRALLVGLMVLVLLLYGCQKTGSAVKKQGEREGTRQAETTTPEPRALRLMPLAAPPGTHPPRNRLLSRRQIAGWCSTWQIRT
jgi:hypothetical protein